MPSDLSAAPESAREKRGFLAWLLRQLPRGNTLDDAQWSRRHRLLQRLLLAHIPFMAGLGWVLGDSPSRVGYTLVAPVVFLVAAHVAGNRRLRSFFTTGGLVFCSAGLVVLTSGSIEAHFHFFIIIGFIALYQDWVPFLWNVGFTVLSHGIGTLWLGTLIFNHGAGQANPWLWSGIHGVAVLAACAGMVVFWRITEDEQHLRETLGKQLVVADAEIGHRKFTSDMLVSLARRNQSMLHRQLELINKLEEKERDPDALGELFRLDHLATRVRRNAESLLVLAGEQSPRTWTHPVPLRDVVRAAIAETEDLGRVVFAVDERVHVLGRCVADTTHLLAELVENAVRYSPPDTTVTVRARHDLRQAGGQLLTIEDWGVGMPPEDLARANLQLAEPHEIDPTVTQRLGLHVVARLAARHGIEVSLGTTPGSGITAVVAMPPALFADPQSAPAVAVQPAPRQRRYAGGPTLGISAGPDQAAEPAARPGWIEPVTIDGSLPTRRPARGIEPETAFTPFGVQAAERNDWRGWWDGPREEQPPAAPERPSVQVPEPRAEQPTTNGNGRPTLRRRVPQSHLAPELRNGHEAPAQPSGVHAGAANALSRYQASRQAAQSEAAQSGGAQ
ncbi:ATP-binding protein [Pseudonocardia sp. CA-107938]|uniref:sensor histidine kinase n=1 Tax=Pseudonocardia sp. CA-107938 TaxID=3240021 RepID=UPI003D923FFA